MNRSTESLTLRFLSRMQLLENYDYDDNGED